MPVFVEAEGFRFYLKMLHVWKETFGAKVYSYCLMRNHVHLILEPCDDVQNISKLMKLLAVWQTRYVNYLERQTGSLWEERCKSSPKETDPYLLVCCRYMEMNSVRAGMVDKLGDFPRSSYLPEYGAANIMN